MGVGFRENIYNFQGVLKNAAIAVNRGRLILSAVHYDKLVQLINGFNGYQLGKARLHELRTSDDIGRMVTVFSEEEIKIQREVNRHIKEYYELVLDETSKEFKRQLGFA